MVDTASTRSPARTGQRAPYANGERKRAELIGAAFAVFAEKGFQRLSVRQIAEEIGTSHTALLHHFGSKDALLEAVLERSEEAQGAWRETVLEERGILETVPEVMRYNARMRGVIQLDVTLRAEAVRPDHPAHAFIKRRDEAFYTSVLEELQREQELGRLKPGIDPALIARMVISLIRGIEESWLYDESIDTAEHLAAFMDLIRNPGQQAPTP
ncbi:TetR/AcrR family transcriptional regulator [Microbacterium deminutum]|uniref:TetR/AcrR family transcriptional regulator n=1 Tax=Microbacterium deminutum TaxID=344164 RepID=A0ABN2R682_9MICO